MNYLNKSKNMKKIALHWKIIIGMVLGVVYGLIANKLGWVDFTNAWIKPWGVIFVNLLKMSIALDDFEN